MGWGYTGSHSSQVDGDLVLQGVQQHAYPELVQGQLSYYELHSKV